MRINQDIQDMIDTAPAQFELVEYFIATLDKKDGTVKSYYGNLKRYLRYLEQNNISKPTEKDVIQFKRKLKEANPDGGATIQKYIVVLRQFYKWCFHKGYYPNIAEGLSSEKIQSKFKRKPLDEDQIKAVLSKAVRRKNKGMVEARNCALIHLLLFTGMRTVEASRANKSDIKVEKDKVYLYIRGKGRDEKDESVLVPQTAYQYLKEYLDKRNDELEPIFIDHSRNRNGNRITTKTISEAMRSLFRLVGIDDPRITAHSLRHTFATIALKNGATPQMVMMVLRHKEMNTTLIYSHNLDRENNNTELLFEKAINNKK